MAQSPSANRDVAEQLARSGQTFEALAAFGPDRRRDAGDVEVRLWIARLQLRMGRTEEAEAGFSAMLREHPADVDASVGLGSALTRRDAWSEALAVLLEAAPRGGENSDPFGRSSVRTASAGTTVVPSATTGGRSRSLRAIRTWSRGTKPRCARNGSSIVVEGFGEAGVSDARAIPVTASIRVLPRLEVEGLAHGQKRNGSSDTLGGGGAIWQINRSTNLAVRGVGGVDNTSLPNGDVMAEVKHYRGAFEIGGVIRHLSFFDAAITAASPLLAWDTGERWRLATRYTLLAVVVPRHRRVLRRQLRVGARNVSRLALRRHDRRIRATATSVDRRRAPRAADDVAKAKSPREGPTRAATRSRGRSTP